LARTRKWALVGSESLLGREVREVVAASGLPVDLRLVSTEPDQSISLTERGGEPVAIWGLERQALEDARVVFLAGSPESTQKTFELGLEGAVLIDLTHAAEDHEHSFLRAPFVEPPGFRAPEDAVNSIAHSAAIAIALVLPHVHAQFPIKRSIIHIFEPASERGLAGLEELQQQTVSLLSFKSLPKKVFDEQASFNMLARYGEEAPIPLESAELRIERHVATLFSHLSESEGAAPPMPSLRLIHTPVFHGYSLSLWMEFGSNPGVDALESALRNQYVDVRGSDLDPPSTAGMAGQSGIAVGAVTMDRNAPRASWLWVAADNLRLAAENAVAVATQFL
jgi:aspartate-semialdehyde dehydrogenase